MFAKIFGMAKLVRRVCFLLHTLLSLTVFLILSIFIFQKSPIVTLTERGMSVPLENVFAKPVGLGLDAKLVSFYFF